MGIGNQIRIARKAAGITQAELAAKVNLSRSHIGAIELDRYNPSVSTLLAIANALNTPITDIMDVTAVHHITEDAFNQNTALGRHNINEASRHNDDTPAYYRDPEVARIAQEMHDNPGIKVLFDAGRGLSKESIEEVRRFIEFQKAKESGDFE